MKIPSTPPSRPIEGDTKPRDVSQLQKAAFIADVLHDLQFIKDLKTEK